VDRELDWVLAQTRFLGGVVENSTTLNFVNSKEMGCLEVNS